MNNENDFEWVAEWSGSYPCLCDGEWSLYHNGEIVNVDIPFQGNDAGTYGIYYAWHFDEDWMETWESYCDGRHEDEWIEAYHDYLMMVTDDTEQWPMIYKAFQEKDWRIGECGGCI